MRSRQGCLTLAVCALLAGGGCVEGVDTAPETAVLGRVRGPDAGAPELVALGAVDPTFGANGVVALPRPGVEPRGMVVQPDGKILLVGSLFVDAESRFEGYAFRFLPDGALDPGFGGSGIRVVTADGLGATTVALAPDGKIVLGGSCDCDLPARVWRLHADGSPDLGFGARGEVALDPLAAFVDHVVVDADGTIRVLGQAAAEGLYLARLRSDGTVDPGYGGGVVPVPDFILHAGVAQPDGAWLLAGAVDPWPDRGGARTIDLARIGPDGAWDRGFGGDGFVELDADLVGTAAAAGGRLLVGLGRSGGQPPAHSRVEARRPDGQLDPGFGRGGATELGPAAEVFRILAQRDGSLAIVSGDQAQVAVHRRGADGAVLGASWLSTLPPSVFIDHLEVAVDPASGDVLAAAIQHRRVVNAGGVPWWMVTSTSLVRIPR